MNPPDTEFEQRLKQLQPASCDALASETFYQAGWNAAMQSNISRGRNQSVLRRHGTSFATGLLCGLMTITAVWPLWNRQQNIVSPNDVVATAEKPLPIKAESIKVVPNGERAPVKHSEQKPNSNPNSDAFDGYSLLAKLSGVQSGSAAATQSLSPVAQRSWSSILLAEPNPGGSIGGTRTTDSPSSLRSFPVTREVIESLL